MSRTPSYPLRLDPLRRAGWQRAAQLEGRTLAGWIKATCDSKNSRDSTIHTLVAKLDEAIDLLENTFYYSFDESVRVRAGEAAEEWRLFLALLAEEGKLP